MSSPCFSFSPRPQAARWTRTGSSGSTPVKRLQETLGASCGNCLARSVTSVYGFRGGMARYSLRKYVKARLNTRAQIESGLMHCHSGNENAPRADGQIVLVGNHNVGKSLIFGWLTGTYVTVANYPGTTVEITRGASRFDGARGVIDTPGVNSLMPISDDERVTRDVLLNEPIRAVVQIADAKNLRRALLITSQIAEFGLPLVLALNMMDEAEARGIRVDAAKLAAIIGAPVIPTTAVRGEGLEELARALDRAAVPPTLVRFGELEECVGALEQDLTGFSETCQVFPPSRARALATMFLSGDASINAYLRARVDATTYMELETIRAQAQTRADTPLSSVIQNARVRWADAVLREVYAADGARRESPASALGRWAVHPVWGVPILLFVLFVLYSFVGKFGAGTLVNYVEGTVFGEWINPFVSELVSAWVPFEIVRDFLVGKYGILTVALTYGFAIILPIVLTFFIAFGILEDSGYLPRLAVMADRAFKAMGLNGKAVLPMVLGLGCDTMATMTTRTLETKKDRVLVTLLLALGVPCSAQLGVVLGMLAGLDARATTIWLGVVTLVLFVVGWLASKVIPGTRSDFIVELPPLRVPQLSHLAVKTLARLEWYLKEVLPLFVLGTVILFALDTLGALSWLERAATPLIVNWLGLPADTTAAFIVGFLRRDYGAAGFFVMAREGLLTPNQIIVALVTITLFVPCIANVFVMVKERGAKTALAITAFIFPTAFAVGGILNLALRTLGG